MNKNKITCMKKVIKKAVLALLPACILLSCHKIDVPVTTELTPNVFPQNQSQFIQAAGPAYAASSVSLSIRSKSISYFQIPDTPLPVPGS